MCYNDSMFKLVKKWDVFLIVLLIAVGLVAYFLGLSRNPGETVNIYVEGRLYGSYSLWENQEISLPTGNRIIVEAGFVQMKEASCDEQSCVRQGKINQAGQTILCLPHQVIIEISGENNDIDAVAK